MERRKILGMAVAASAAALFITGCANMGAGTHSGTEAKKMAFAGAVCAFAFALTFAGVTAVAGDLCFGSGIGPAAHVRTTCDEKCGSGRRYRHAQDFSAFHGPYSFRV